MLTSGDRQEAKTVRHRSHKAANLKQQAPVGPRLAIRCFELRPNKTRIFRLEVLQVIPASDLPGRIQGSSAAMGSVLKYFFWMGAVMALSALAACGSGGGGSDVPLPPPPPAITTQPVAVTVEDGQTASFSVVASGAGLVYQWLRNGAAITGATSATYSSAAAAADNGARFSVRVLNTNGEVTSASALLTVTPATVSIARAPDPAAVVTGSPVTFSVFAGGTAPFAYQWLRGGVAIPGATQSTYTFTTALVDDGAQFSAVVTNVAGTATSSSALLSVFAQPQAITILSQPQDVTVRDGGRPTFTVVLSGTGPFTVQWIRNGVDLPLTRLENVSSTQYSFSLVRATIAADNGALYSLRITNAFGSVTTRQALLTVIP